MDLTIHHLRCFLAVAQELHFGRAASRLHLSPSSLSEQVSALERRLARPLFQRSSRSVELTAQGRELLPLARKAVAAMDEVLGWGGGAAADPRIRVGLMVSSPQFRTIMSAAARELPAVRWEIRQLGFLGSYDALAAAEVDCAFVAEVGQAPAPQFEPVRLWDEGCTLVVAEHHRLAGRGSVRLADLAGETFVAVEDEALSSQWLSAVAAPDGPGLRTLPVARSFEEVLELCGAGLGVNIAGAPPCTTYLCLRSGKRPAQLQRFVQLAVGLGSIPPPDHPESPNDAAEN
jgi:DNA-binding transcriptional LysR family regulator